jgi:hypothetical protein
MVILFVVLQCHSAAAMRQYTVNPTFNLNLEASVPLTIASDSSRLADYVDFTAKTSQASFMQSLTLSALSGQSSTGG